MNKNTQKAAFTVTAAPRHAVYYPQAYAAQDHSYQPEYINPSQWTLFLNACPAPTARPAGATRYKWTVRHAENAFWPIEVENEHPNDCRAEVHVPAAGRLTISLETLTHAGDRRHTEQNFHLRDLLIVALGDSYTCGEGVPDRAGKIDPATKVECNTTLLAKLLKEAADVQVHLSEEPAWQEPKAHRSYQSGVARGVRDFEDPNTGRLTTFLTFACSGAGVEEGFLQPQMDWQSVGQVQEAQQNIAGRRKIDALILTVGGNDVEFGWGIKSLAKPELSFGGLIELGKSRAEVIEAAEARLERLPDRLDRLAQAIDRRLAPEHTFLLEYPVAMFDLPNGGVSAGCGIFDSIEVLKISQQDADRMKDFGLRLNAVLSQAANRLGWVFVEGIKSGFTGHGYCSGQSYYVLAEDSCKIQGDFSGTMHPNEAGHAVYARRLAAKLDERLGD